MQGSRLGRGRKERGRLILEKKRWDKCIFELKTVKFEKCRLGKLKFLVPSINVLASLLLKLFKM